MQALAESERQREKEPSALNLDCRWGLLSFPLYRVLLASARRAQMRAGAMNLDSEAGEAGEQGLKKASYLAAGKNCMAAEQPLWGRGSKFATAA